MDKDNISQQPYISMNKLAEYMTATPLRRRQIIKILKKDSDFYKVYYSELKNVLNKYFESDYDFDLLDDLINKIEGKQPASDWDKLDNENTLLAIENLLESNLPDLTEYNFDKKVVKLKEIIIEGVRVTIKPDFYLVHKETNKVGAIKTHIAKTPDNQLEDENRMYAATLLKYAFLEKGIQENEIDNVACISYDIFKKDFTHAPNSYKRIMLAVEAACEEIALRWNSN